MNSKISKMLSFTKVEHTIFSVPLLFSGAWLGAGRQMPSARILGLLLLAGVGARILGMSMNRIFDRKIDASNPRTRNRELPSGQMSLHFAGVIAFAGLAMYLVSCWSIGPLVLKLSPVPAVVLIGYSLLKRFTPLCHFGIGACLGLAPIGSYVAASGSLTAGNDILLLAGFAFCWISGFDIIYALQDISFDKGHGVHSIPALLGSRWAQIVAGILHVAALALLVGLMMETGGEMFATLALVVAAGAFVYGNLPSVPLPKRFFPVSAIACIAGSLVPIFGG
jgi:4-hydroxybenzoate polyprenyltransferase